MRVFHHDPTCRVCQTARPGIVATAGPLPPPYPNPLYPRKMKDANPIQGGGGQHGHHWYHGTTFDPYEDEGERPSIQDSGGELRTPLHHRDEDDEGPDNFTHWNTNLGVHFTSMHHVADTFAQGHGGKDQGEDYQPNSRIAHASLHMRNPIHFKDEDELASHTINWARSAGHRYLPDHKMAAPAFQHANYDFLAEHDSRGHDWEDLGIPQHSREHFVNIDHNGPGAADMNTKDVYLNTHPEREEIINGYRKHLQSQGHDGIIYGNSHEGPKGHPSAIAFPETPVTVHHWEWMRPQERTKPPADERQMKLFGRRVTGAFEFRHEERQTGGTKFPTRGISTAHHPETGEEAARVEYFPPKRKGGPISIDDVRSNAPGAASALLNEIETRHPGSSTKFLHEVKRNNNNPDVTGHAHERAGNPSDWDTHYPNLADTIHRGFALRLPSHAARTVNSGAPKDEHLAALHESIPTGPSLGMHWTENEHSARQFAHNAISDYRTQVPVVLHARTPARKDIETRQQQLYRGGVFPYGDEHSKENEVPVRKGRKVEVTGISWRPDAPHPDADETGWVHHQYPDSKMHTARRVAALDIQHYHLEGPNHRAVGDDASGRHMLDYQVTPQNRIKVTNDWNEPPEHHMPLLTSAITHHGAEGVHGPEHDAPPAPEKPQRRVYYHGTTVSDVTHVLPASKHGGDVIWHSDTDPDYAYASTNLKDAWDYAEGAFNHGFGGATGRSTPPGPPRVYQVRPIGGDHSHVEEDPTWDDRLDKSRGNNSSDRRSKLGWEVVREMKMPRHMGKPEDWMPGGERH